jgi:hypothetical protein
MMMFVDGMSILAPPRRGVEIVCFSADLPPMCRRQSLSDTETILVVSIGFD